MNGKIDRAHLKKVGLTAFDIQLLGLLMQTGGEYPMPATAAGRAGVAVSCSKNLVTIVQRYGEQQCVRLTDEGRTVLAQLKQMEAQPKVEVDNR